MLYNYIAIITNSNLLSEMSKVKNTLKQDLQNKDKEGKVNNASFFVNIFYNFQIFKFQPIAESVNLRAVDSLAIKVGVNTLV